jgi:hypothetical protein
MAGLVTVHDADKYRSPIGQFLAGTQLRFGIGRAKIGMPMPITSPVDFISGPSKVSTPGKRSKGSTASLTEMGESGMTSW